MKIVAYTALRYGKDYLGWAIRSVINHVDEYHVLYAAEPSHGHYSAAPCPDSYEELYNVAFQAAGSKLRWHTGHWQQEGEQRNAIFGYMPDADAILSVDSDEIYSEKLINNIVHYIQTINEPTRFLCIPFIHYWRSFNRCVLHDPAYPARVILPKNKTSIVKTWDDSMGVVNHMGYATMPEIVAYKWQIHGHLAELRTDVNWLRDVFMANRQYDCHPVGSEYWNPEQVSPLAYMPYWMVEHPFFNMQVIE